MQPRGFAPALLTLTALAALTRVAPRARKIVVAPDINWARETLFALAWRSGGWIGWEAATLRSLAEELAFAELGRSGRRVASDVQLTTLIDEALAGAVAAKAVGPAFSGLAGGLGFRNVVRDSALELCTAGITAAQVRNAAGAGSTAHDLATILATTHLAVFARRARAHITLRASPRPARATIAAACGAAPSPARRSSAKPGIRTAGPATSSTT